VTEENNAHVEIVIKENSQPTYDTEAESSAKCLCQLTQLNMKKVWCQWVPHNLTAAQKQT